MLKVCAVFTLHCGLLAPASALSFSTSLSSDRIPEFVRNLLDDAADFIRNNEFANDLYQGASNLLDKMKDQVRLNIDSLQLADIKYEKTGTDGQVAVKIPFNAVVDTKIYRMELKYRVQADLQGRLQVLKDHDGIEFVTLRDCKLPPDSLEMSSENSFSLGKFSSLMSTQVKPIIARNLGNQMCWSINTLLRRFPADKLKENLNLSSTEDKKGSA